MTRIIHFSKRKQIFGHLEWVFIAYLCSGGYENLKYIVPMLIYNDTNFNYPTECFRLFALPFLQRWKLQFLYQVVHVTNVTFIDFIMLGALRFYFISTRNKSSKWSYSRCIWISTTSFQTVYLHEQTVCSDIIPLEYAMKIQIQWAKKVFVYCWELQTAANNCVWFPKIQNIIRFQINYQSVLT